jgi:hypothetical protein
MATSDHMLIGCQGVLKPAKEELYYNLSARLLIATTTILVCQSPAADTSEGFREQSTD